MKFYPGSFVVFVYKAVSVAAETVHISERSGNASRRHGDRDLMKCLRKESPEIPVACRVAEPCPRVAFLWRG